MNYKLVRSRAGILAVFVVLAMAVTGCGILSRAEAPEAEHEDGQPTASVSASGFGEATGAPDMATVQLGVETEADTIAAALDQSNQTVDSVTTALLGVGIAETDIQSFNFNVWPEVDFDRLTGQPTGERTYHVDSTLSDLPSVLQSSAGVAERVDAGDLKSPGALAPSGFESRSRHPSVASRQPPADSWFRNAEAEKPRITRMPRTREGIRR